MFKIDILAVAGRAVDRPLHESKIIRMDALQGIPIVGKAPCRIQKF